MEHFNQALFLLINAAPGSADINIYVASAIAEYPIWLIPVALIFGWPYGTHAIRQQLIVAIVSGFTGLLINQIIGWLWYHPRPFEMGIGHTFVSHVQDSSFPSDHLTFIWAFAFSHLLHRKTSFAGWTFTVLGLPVAWARIYLGVHFPLDILGAVFVALSSSWLISQQEHRLIEPLTGLLLRIYQVLFAGLIRRGWARQ